MNALYVSLNLPPRALSPNARAHWRSKAKAVAQYRRDATVEALQVLDGRIAPRWAEATISFAFYLPDKRRRDIDNLEASMKSAIDGLVDAGILADDDKLTRLPSLRFVDPGFDRVVVEVKPAHARDGAGEGEA